MNEEMNDPGEKRTAPVEETSQMDCCNNGHRQKRDYKMLELVLWPNQAS